MANQVKSTPPESILPSYWHDSGRMNALYAPIRSKVVNPQDWDSKITFWSDLVRKYLLESKLCCFTMEDLNKAFWRDGRAPACLKDVMEELNRLNEIQTPEKFTQLTMAQTWTGWAINTFVKSPISWSFSKVIATPPNIVETSKFIHVEVLKKLSEELYKSVNIDDLGRVITIEALMETLREKVGTKFSAETTQFCLDYLKAMKKVTTTEVVFHTHDNPNRARKVELVKFSESFDANVMGIDQTETSVFSLKENEKSLIANIEKLERDKDKVMVEAKGYLAKGMRQMAKNSLRKKHELDKFIEKRISVLANVQTLLGRITEVECDTNVVQSYKNGVKALKDAFEDGGITEDNVNDVIEDVQEVLEMQDDVKSLIGRALVDNTEDDAELESELAELLASDNDSGLPGGGSPEGKVENKQEIPEQVDEDFDQIEKRLRALRPGPTLPDLPSPSKHSPSEDELKARSKKLSEL